MKILQSIVLLVIGFVLLIKGADFFVEGSSSVAKRLRIPSIIIGLTIVAMGTSLPECAVSVVASINGSNSLAVSNVVGSNIFNLMVVCGICALFSPLAVSKNTVKKEFPFSIVCAGLLLVLGLVAMTLGRMDGIVFLIIFIAYILWMVFSAIQNRTSQSESGEQQVLSGWKCLLFIVGGMVAIKFGGDFVVEGAVAIARLIGLTETLIGLTIVALGTSLPELVTSIVAARKNELDMAVGNVIGSNIFNILFVLGVASSISPIAFLWENVIDIIVLMVVSIVVWIFAWTKGKINWAEGVAMLVIYSVYMVYICAR